MLIGLTGPAGVGKDTAGAILREKFGFKTFAFAEPLKQAMAALGLPEPVDRADKEKPVPGFSFTWRQAIQRLGTECVQGLDKNFWVVTLEKRIEGYPLVVVTDVRFPHEAEWLNQQGGYLIGISGRATTITDVASKAHASESSNLSPDFTVDNAGSLEQFTANLLSLPILKEDFLK